MLSVVVTEHGGPHVMQVQETPDLVAAAGEAVVQTTAIGVNYIDTYQRDGTYPVPTPFVPGSEGAGTVIATGDGVDGISVGDRVAWKAAPGSYATQVRVSQHEVVPIPDGVTDELAAAVMLQGMTAHYLSHSTYPVEPGDVALVHAGAGGVGLLLTQMIKARGGVVISTVSTEEKAELSKAAGADHVIGYDEVPHRVRELTGGAGAAVAYDGVGKDTFDASLASLRIRGCLVLYGGASGQVAPFDPQRLNAAGGIFLTRPSLPHYTRDRAELMARSEDLFSWIAAGTLDVRIGGRYPLADSPKAHADLESRRTTGKLVLLP